MRRRRDRALHPADAVSYTRADAEAWVERCADVWRKREAFPLAIVDYDSGELLGSIELNPTTRTVG